MTAFRLALRQLARPSPAPLRFAPRALSTTVPTARFTSFDRPGPPPLPAEDQAEFERLVKEAEEAATVDPDLDAKLAAIEKGEVLEAAKAELSHPDARKGPAPEFEGEVNPKTGEIGGPKRDPFVAGNADWQFGGRVTDF